MEIESPDRKDYHQHTSHQRIEHHITSIELQTLLCPGTNTGYTDNKESHYLAINHVARLINYPLPDS